MRINGIGAVKKEEAMKILTAEGRRSVKAGEISTEELGEMYKLRWPEGSPCIRPAPNLSPQHGPIRAEGKYLIANLEEPTGDHCTIRAKVIPLPGLALPPGVGDHCAGSVKPVPPAIGIPVPVIAYRLASIAVVVSPDPGLLDPSRFLFRLCDDAPVRDPVSQDLAVVFAVGLPADSTTVGDNAGCAGRVALNGLDPCRRHLCYDTGMVRPLAVCKKDDRSRLWCPAPPTGFFEPRHPSRAIMVQITAQEPSGSLQAECLDKYLRHIHGTPGLALEVLAGMFPVIPGKACIVFVSGVGRKIVQVPVALFLQVSIPGLGLSY